ncbi:WxL domain-containing protein [Lactobacillus selangorensis]|nr:WxL domain-containing protein [Lactobacillus selangorensis]
MKKGLATSVLFSAFLLGGFSSTAAVQAATTSTPQPANSTADISFATDNQPTQPAAPADPDQPATGNAGPLSLDTVPNLHFGQQQVDGNTTSYAATNAHPYVQVTDKTGTKAGWNVTVRSTAFKASDGKSDLGATELTFAGAKIARIVANSAIGVPTGGDVTLKPDNTEVNFMNATAGAGIGTWVADYAGGYSNGSKTNTNIRLKVLGNEQAIGTYTATLTWNLAAGPTA